MNPDTQKVVQYLNEAHATRDRADARAAVADRDDPARRLPLGAGDAPRRDPRSRRPRRARGSRSSARAQNPLQAVVGAAETVIGQALALGKTPIDLLRGSGGEEKVLKNAKDACADRGAGDRHLHRDRAPGRAPSATTRPRKLAASIRADEEKMLARVLREIPKLTDAVVGAEVDGKPSYDISETGAGESGQGRRPRRPSAPRARPARFRASRGPRARSRAPSPPRTTCAIDRYDAADRRRDRRAGCRSSRRSTWPRSTPTSAVTRTARTVLDRVSALRGDEPWPGYDELNAAEVRPRSATPPTSASRPSAPTSARTRTARPCSTRPSGS